MLLKKKKIATILFCSLFSIALWTSCSSDDSSPTDDTTTDPTDDTTDDTTDDQPPSGFLGELDWIVTYGGSESDEAVAIIPTTDNNYMVLGTTRSSDGDISNKTSEKSDFWLLKISENGSILWDKTYGGSEDDVATSIAQTDDGGYILAGYSRSNDGHVSGNEGFHDYWILKVDSNGNVQWDKNFGFLGSDQAFSIFQTSDGGYFVSGFFDVSASEGEGNDGFNSGNNDRGGRHGVGEYWAIKMDADGEYIWRRYFGGSNNDRSYSARETSDGSFIVIGSSESGDFDITDSKGSYDYWVVKIGPTGDKIFTKSYGGSEIDVAYTMCEAGNNQYLLAGDARSADQDVSSPKGNADLWLIKINSNGNLLWEKSLGGSAFDSAKGIVPAPEGNYAITGSSRSADQDVSNNNGENDAWTILVDASGNLIFEMSLGGSSLDFGEDLTISNDGSSLIVVGNTESNDGDIPENKGIKDALIFKIK